MTPDQAHHGLAGTPSAASGDHCGPIPERSRLAEAVTKYAATLRSCYPTAVGDDPLTVGVRQIADVLEDKACTLAPMAFRLWVTQYAQALFRTHPDRDDPYSLGVCGIAGDLEIALLAWGSPDEQHDAFEDVAADVFGIGTPGTP